ncbi:hypothetical protein LTR95_011839 [Oleoguttula sp. CCFEE 5521]
MANATADLISDIFEFFGDTAIQPTLLFAALTILFLAAIFSYKHNSGQPLLWTSGILLQATVPILYHQLSENHITDLPLRVSVEMIFTQYAHAGHQCYYVITGVLRRNTVFWSRTVWLCGMWGVALVIVEVLVSVKHYEQVVYHLLASSGFAVVHLLCSVAVGRETRELAHKPASIERDLEKCKPGTPATYTQDKTAKSPYEFAVQNEA